MNILAFAGFRMSGRNRTAGSPDPGDLAAPPFDQIDDAARDRFHAQSPHHFAHLTRPAGEQPYQQVASLHDAWIAQGAVVRDAAPALYPYAIELAQGGRRLGLCCLVGIGGSESASLRPHEETVDKPLQDRLALLEATRVDLEPVLLIAEDPGTLDSMLAADSVAKHEVARHRDPATGDRHVIYRIEDRARIASYRDTLAPRAAVIADGHHRTKVAQLFAAKHTAQAGSAAAAKLAVITSVASRGLTIDPIHRGLAVKTDRAAIESRARSRAPFAGDSGEALAAAVAAAPAPALGVRFAGSPPEIWQLDPDLAPNDTPGRDAALAVVLLHYDLLRAGGLELSNARDGSILYRANPDSLFQLVERGEVQAGFWLPPMTPQAFAAATKNGEVLPPKSTRFLPKLVSGLVWCGHDAAVG